jgi:cell division inhibitor SulA
VHHREHGLVELHSVWGAVRERQSSCTWLPNGACSKNFESEFVLDLDAFRKRRRPRELKLPPVVSHLRQAERFQTLLDAGEAASRAWLARQHGLTRARVTQLMSLLLLHPDILDYVRNLPVGTPERLVTEKKLRTLTKLPVSQQLARAARVLTGFTASRVA